MAINIALKSFTLVPVSPPKFASEVYDPDEMCYLIVNRKSNARLFARTFKGKEDDDFGFVEHYAEVNDSQKWQILKEELKELKLEVKQLTAIAKQFLHKPEDFTKDESSINEN